MDVVKDVAMKDAPVEEGKDCKGDEDSEQQPTNKEWTKIFWYKKVCNSAIYSRP